MGVRMTSEYKQTIISGEVTERNSDGTVKAIYNVKDGVEDGPYESFWTNGNTKAKMNKKNGEIEGDRTLYREDGTREKWENFHQGEKNGRYIIYDKTGKNIVEDGVYRHGEKIHFNREEITQSGKKIQLFGERQPNGEMKHSVFCEGRLIAEGMLREPLQLKDEYTKNDFRAGEFKTYFSDPSLKEGQLKEAGFKKNGVLDGEYIHIEQGWKRTREGMMVPMIDKATEIHKIYKNGHLVTEDTMRERHLEVSSPERKPQSQEKSNQNIFDYARRKFWNGHF